MGSGMPYCESAQGFQALIPGTCQRVSYTASAAQSAALGNTVIVQLYSTTDCWIKFGSNPTAVANDGTSVFLPGGMVICYGVTAGHKVSAIRDSASGDLHIVEGA